MASILGELLNTKSINDVTVIGDAAFESEITLTAIRAECANDEEFCALLESAGVEMALYGVISDAELATEAVKKIVIKDFKEANFKRIVYRTAIRLAMKAGGAEYTEYKKARDKFIEKREKLYKKWYPKAVPEARKIMKNARNKASGMSSSAGNDIGKKIDNQIQKASSGN